MTAVSSGPTFGAHRVPLQETHFILATAGHVDHGKSALVKALTGTDPDRLPEEKARGITIDLGFAELNLTGPNGEKFHIGIIDVPGHEAFVRNMIAGVGSIDLALLIVAADDGWMPQTEEHLQILTYLEIKRIVVAVTKSDLADTDRVVEQVRQKLSDSMFADAQVIPVSANTGDGLGNLKRALVAEFGRLSPPRDIGKPRLFVDRVFTLRGIGTVVTGTLTGGQLRTGQNVVVQPANLPARIRSIQSHGRDVEVAEVGTRTAVSLPELSVEIGPGAVKRGDVITIAELGSSSTTLGVVLKKSNRLGRNSPAARPLKTQSSAHVYFGTKRTSAKIVFLDTNELQPGKQGIAEVRLDSPILPFLADRFVIRDPSERYTIGGGTVLDPEINKDGKGRLELLKARAASPRDATVCLQTEIVRSGLLPRKAVLTKSHFSASEISEALSRLVTRGDIILQDEIAADAGKWRRLRQQASLLIEGAHRSHQEERGLDMMKLRAALTGLDDNQFAALVADLCANDFIRVGSVIARTSHRPTLSTEIHPAAENIRLALAAKPFDPPSRRELAPDANLQKALRFLIEQREVIDLDSDIVLLRDAAERMQDAVIEFLSAKIRATASELRQKIGTSRRIIIPFLEHLDRAGVTRRIGDQRELRQAKAPTVAPR